MCYVNCEVIDMWKKTALAALAVLALAAAYIRPVYSVTVGSRPLQGSWDKQSLDEASAMAMAAAEEVARSGSRAPVYETKMHLSLLPASSDAPELARELLSGYEGVQRAYRVNVDGVDIGIAEDATAFDEIVLAYIAQYAPVDCVSAGLDSQVELEEVYIPQGKADDIMDISAKLRGAARVSYITSGGERVYA